MPYPIRVSEGLTFQVKDFVKSFWQKWDATNNKMLKSDEYQTGFSKKYLFNLTDGQQLELSKDQWSQAICGAFDWKKHWKDCQFQIKTNGKTGLEVRYFVNVVKTPQLGSVGIISPNPPQTNATGQISAPERPIYPDTTVPPEVLPAKEEFDPNEEFLPFKISIVVFIFLMYGNPILI